MVSWRVKAVKYVVGLERRFMKFLAIEKFLKPESYNGIGLNTDIPCRFFVFVSSKFADNEAKKKKTKEDEPGDKFGDERIRIARFESSEEGPHIADERQSKITRWK